MTVGTHTWSHKDLARGSYAKDLEKAEQEIELGNSAVHAAAAGHPLHRSFDFPIYSKRRSCSTIWRSAISRSSLPTSTHATLPCTSRSR
jgi:hypothetical protein